MIFSYIYSQLRKKQQNKTDNMYDYGNIDDMYDNDYGDDVTDIDEMFGYGDIDIET